MLNFANLLYVLEDYEPYLYQEIKNKTIFKPNNENNLYATIRLYYDNKKDCIDSVNSFFSLQNIVRKYFNFLITFFKKKKII